MRIVFLTPSLPWRGGRADMRLLANLLPEVARRGIDVTCVSSHEEPAEAVAAARDLAARGGYELVPVRLRLGEARCARKFASARRPFSELARSAPLADALEQALRPGYDVLHVDQLFTAWAASSRERRVVYVSCLETVDLEGTPRVSAGERFTFHQYRRGTRLLLRREPRLVAMTDRLAREAARWHRGAIPIARPAFDAGGAPASPCREPVVGVIGSMFWRPSRSAAERVLTRLWGPVRERVPAARLLVAGWKSDRYLAHHFPLAGAELLGPVPDADAFFSRCSVLLYPPERGTGVKVKVLDAMARGLAVVSNREGLEGLPDDAPVLRGESDEELVDATVRVLEDASLRARVQAESRVFPERYFASTAAADELLAGYATLGLAGAP